MVEFQSQDLLLSVGKTHYPDVEDFINEAKVHGVSKAISVTSGNQPPEVNPGRTRLFLIHPNAVGVEREVETTAGEMKNDDELLEMDGEAVEGDVQDPGDDVPVKVKRSLRVPGVFGYTYLTRVVYTEDADGNVPAYIQEYEAIGDLDIVKTGRETPYSEQAGFNDDGELEADAADALEAHYGRNPHETDEVHREPGGFVEEAAEALAALDADPVPALEAPTIEKMEKAPLGELAEMGTVEARRPPEGEDHIIDGEGALAVVSLDNQQYKVMPTNILSVDGESRTATTQVGPYSVEVASPIGGDVARTVEVTNTR